MSVVARTVAFCRALRERGVDVTTAHAIDAVRALEAVGLERDDVYYALRAVLVTRREEYAIFDELFAQAAEAPKKRAQEEGEASVTSFGGAQSEGEEEMPGASDQPALAEKDFSTFRDDELEEIERVARRIARRLASRPSRRWKPARRGARVDLRRTLRRATAGELAKLALRRRKPRKTRIVALCDVSGSMDLYSRLLLQFLYALHGAAARVESFVFSTELRRVTPALSASDYAAALRALSAEAHDFSGGTRIGECLAAFNESFGRLVDSRTIVVVLSDGWDTGEPEVLSDALRTLRRRGKKLVWLNPLLGSPGYEPLTVGMQAALPHLSVFAPAHNLQALQKLARHLS